jgi:ABC-type antimicrobial peptide transport system permease subunit
MNNDLFWTERIRPRSKIAPLSGYPLLDRRLKAIDKSFLDSTYTSLYTLTEYDKNLNISKTTTNKIDINKMLYDNPNTPKVLKEKNDSFIYPQNDNRRIQKIIGDFQLNIFASEGIRKLQAIGVDIPARVSFTDFSPHSIPCKVIGMVSKLPGVRSYSSYNLLARNSEAYVSMDQLKQLIEIEKEIYHLDLGDVSNKTVNGIRKRQMILKYKDTATKELKDMVFFAMNNYIGGLDCFCIQLDDIIEISQKVKKIIGSIFLVLGIIALVLSFFLIWTSFYSNIRENIAEYGIMRSIGVTKAQSVRIYLYEAATIILSSIIIGTFIGVVISTSLILQFDVFLELPFVFNFPFLLYFVLIAVGLGLGLLGSYYPTYAVNTLSLVKIMKGFNE